MLKLRRLKRNKQANILDFFYIIPIIILCAIVFIASYYILDRVDLSGIFADDPTANTIITRAKSTAILFDNMIFFIMIGLSIFTLVSAYFVFNHPVFFFALFIILCVAVIIAAQFSNAYEEFRTSSQLTDPASFFSKTNFVVDKLPIYILFMGMMTLIIMGVSYYKEYG